jgi:uncharacterized protein (TIGR03435 family)
MLVGAPQAAQNPQFEVASVKPSNGAPIGAPGTDGGPGTRYPERFATKATLQGLVYRAFGLVDFQEQIRGPAWTSKRRIRHLRSCPTRNY